MNKLFKKIRKKTKITKNKRERGEVHVENSMSGQPISHHMYVEKKSG